MHCRSLKHEYTGCMKVIFKKDVGGVGQRGSVKEVSDGYALNFLIPNGLAEQATPEKVAAHKKVQDALKQDQDARDREFERYAETIRGKRLQINVRASSNGNLYKALSAAEIIEEIRNVYRVEIPFDSIVLNAPVKKLGETDITVQFGGHTAHLTLIVIA